MGDDRVGKTAIINTFICDKAHNGRRLATIDLDKTSKVIEINEKKIKIFLLDHGWSEKYRVLYINYIPKAQAFIIVYNVLDRRSFNDLNE